MRWQAGCTTHSRAKATPGFVANVREIGAAQHEATKADSSWIKDTIKEEEGS
jgi:hypothetical protein